MLVACSAPSPHPRSYPKSSISAETPGPLLFLPLFYTQQKIITRARISLLRIHTRSVGFSPRRRPLGTGLCMRRARKGRRTRGERNAISSKPPPASILHGHPPVEMKKQTAAETLRWNIWWPPHAGYGDDLPPRRVVSCSHIVVFNSVQQTLNLLIHLRSEGAACSIISINISHFCPRKNVYTREWKKKKTFFNLTHVLVGEKIHNGLCVSFASRYMLRFRASVYPASNERYRVNKHMQPRVPSGTAAAAAALEFSPASCSRDESQQGLLCFLESRGSIRFKFHILMERTRMYIISRLARGRSHLRLRVAARLASVRKPFDQKQIFRV